MVCALRALYVAAVVAGWGVYCDEPLPEGQELGSLWTAWAGDGDDARGHVSFLFGGGVNVIVLQAGPQPTWSAAVTWMAKRAKSDSPEELLI